MKRAASLLSSSLAFVACAIITDYDGLAGNPVTTGGDGAAPMIIADATTKFEASAEGGAIDSGLPPPGPLCAPSAGHALCDTFDEPDSSSRWTRSIATTPATVGLDDSTSASSPLSLRGMVKGMAAGATQSAYWNFLAPGTFSYAHLECDLFMPRPSSDSARIVLLLLDDERRKVGFELIGGKFFVSDSVKGTGGASSGLGGGGDPKRHSIGNLQPSRWFHVALDLNENKNKVSVDIGNGPEVRDLQPSATSIPTLRLDVGIASASSGVLTTFFAHVDNVVLDRE